MARKFIDGCTHYGTAHILHKYESKSSYVNIVTENPRRAGVKSLQFVDTTGWSWVKTRDIGLTTEGYVGVAVRPPVTQTYRYGAITFYKDSTAQVTAMWDPDGKLYIKRGDVDGTTLASSAVGQLPEGGWCYVEFYGKPDDSTGAAEIRVNGSTVISVSGEDTKPDTATGCNAVMLLGRGSHQMTDVYVDDAAFQGDCIIETLMPTADGTESDFTPLSGTNEENIDDDGTIDDDSTYNYSATQGDMDTFVTEDVENRPASDILSVAVNVAMRKDDASTRVVKPVARVNSTNYPHSTGVTLISSYKVGQRIWDDNPDDSNPWEEADVNGAEFGYEQSSVT